MISGFVDASWNIASVSGAIILVARGDAQGDIPETEHNNGLSSAEAELSALTEGCKESIYLTLLLETLLSGMPEPEQLVCIQYGSQATVRPRSPSRRWLACYAEYGILSSDIGEEQVSSGRVTLSFIQGESNPSDGLTKSPEGSLFDHLVATCGLERLCEEDVQSLMVPENLKRAVEELEEVREKLEKLPKNLQKYASVARELALGLSPPYVVIIGGTVKLFISGFGVIS